MWGEIYLKKFRHVIVVGVAGTDFSQTGSLVKERHLLQRQLSASTGGGKLLRHFCLKGWLKNSYLWLQQKELCTSKGIRPSYDHFVWPLSRIHSPLYDHFVWPLLRIHSPLYDHFVWPPSRIHSPLYDHFVWPLLKIHSTCTDSFALLWPLRVASIDSTFINPTFINLLLYIILRVASIENSLHLFWPLRVASIDSTCFCIYYNPSCGLYACPGSTPFVPTVRSSSSRKSVPIAGISNKINRERGTKVSPHN